MLNTPNLSLPYIDVNAAQREVVHNEAIRGLDALVQLAVLDRDLTAPPGSPSDGQRWLVAASPTGAWSGHAADIAGWQDGAWRFYTPRTGWLVYVVDEGVLLGWNGSGWVDALSLLTTIQNVSLFGVGTTADATNPFSAKLNNALWTAKTVAEGGDGHLRYKMSKESASKTLSVLMQTNFSGRAEVGLTGDDDLHIKVSPDGSTWYESLIVSRSSGVAGLGVNGSAGAPALTWSGDPDNGLYRTGANAWSLACAGAQAIGIAASVISIPYTTASTSTTTGALTVGGGGGFAGTVSASAFLVGSTAVNAIRRTTFGFGSSYVVVGIGEYSGTNSISLGVNVNAISGGSFAGAGDIIIPKSGSIIAPNAGATDFVGVIRSNGTNVYIGPAMSAGLVATNQLTVYGTGGVTIGAPTGGDKGTGTLNVAADIYKNNTAYTNPDFVFEHFYRGCVERFIESPGAKEYAGLMPLPALRDFTRRELRLPGIDDKPMGIFGRGDAALRLIEENSLYISRAA
jgi:hypothetical protein